MKKMFIVRLTDEERLKLGALEVRCSRVELWTRNASRRQQ